jgi:hypothetical protein
VLLVILVGTSAWIDHFRKEDVSLVGLLAQIGAAMHAFVIRELAIGGYRIAIVPFRVF